MWYLGLLWWMRSNVLHTLGRSALAWGFRLTMFYQHCVKIPTKTQNPNKNKLTELYYNFQILWFLLYLISPPTWEKNGSLTLHTKSLVWCTTYPHTPFKSEAILRRAPAHRQSQIIHTLSPKIKPALLSLSIESQDFAGAISLSLATRLASGILLSPGHLSILCKSTNFCKLFWLQWRPASIEFSWACTSPSRE